MSISENKGQLITNRANQHILLAEDDHDDYYLFQLALEQLDIPCELTKVKNGQQLMELLNKENAKLPDIIFLDINMPIKNGFECLAEIKRNENLKHLPVIICSTSYSPVVVDQLYKDGALYYIRKPDDIAQYQEMIFHALTLIDLPGEISPSL